MDVTNMDVQPLGKIQAHVRPADTLYVVRDFA